MTNVRNWLGHHALATYFVLSLVLTWAIAIPLALTTQRLWDYPLSAGLHYLTALGPLLAALLVTSVTAGKPGLANMLERITRVRIGWRWWVIAAGSPVGLFALAALVARVAEGSWPDLSGLGTVNFLGDIGPTAALVLWIVTFGFGEETGWRGFALANLQRRHSVATATAVVAVIWAVWHAPFWFYLPSYQDLGIAGTPGFFIGLFLGAILMTWLYNSTGGSIAAVAVWHALFNFFSGSQATDGLMNGVMSTAVAFWAVGIVVFAYWRRSGVTQPDVGSTRVKAVRA
jgi:membrane protease YdiL (CAAX protease family)